MINGIVLLGDNTDHGGKVITASSIMFFNGRQAVLVGDLVDCPIIGHGINPIIEGDSTFQDNGKAVVVHFCLSACGCHVLSSSPQYSSES